MVTVRIGGRVGPPGPQGISGAATVLNTERTTNYTFALDDTGTVVKGNSASGLTFTIPPQSDVEWLNGSWLDVVAYGVGQITIDGGLGVTLRAPYGAKTANQYARVALYRLDEDEWLVDGATTT